MLYGFTFKIRKRETKFYCINTQKKNLLRAYFYKVIKI